MRTPLLNYAAAHGGKTLFWTASDLYFAFYMNEVCGIPPGITGLIVGGSIFLAAFVDLAIGRWFASAVHDAEEAGRLQQNGAMASAIGLLLFAAAAFVPPDWRVGACIATLLIFRIAYAVIDVPQNALLSLATHDEDDRTAMVAGRQVSGGIARVALATAFVPIMNVQPPTDAAPRFLWLVALMAVIVVPSAMLLARRVAGFAARSLPSAEVARIQAGGHYLRMFVASATLTGFIQLQPYLATRGIADHAVGATFMATVAIGSIVSQPLWRIRAREGGGRLWNETLGATAIAAVALPVLPLQSLQGSAAAGLLYGLASGGLLFALWTAFAQVAARPEAFAVYARFTAAAKFGQAVAIFAIGIVLQMLRAGSDEAWRGTIPWVMTIILFGGAILLGLASIESKARVDRRT